MLVNRSRPSSAIGRIARGAYRDVRLGCAGVLLILFSFLTTRRLVGPKLHMMSGCSCLSSTALAAELLAVERAYPDDEEVANWLLSLGEKGEEDDDGDSDGGIFFFKPDASLIVALALEVRDSDAEEDTFFLAVDGNPRAEIILDDAEKNFGDEEDDEELPLLLLGDDEDELLLLLPPDGDVDHIPPNEEENAACCSPPSLGVAAPRLLALGRFCHLRLSDGELRDDDDVVPVAMLLEKVCSLTRPPWCPPPPPPPPWPTPSDEDEMLPLAPLLQRHQGWPSPPPLLTAPERALGPSLLLLFLKSMLEKSGDGVRLKVLESWNGQMDRERDTNTKSDRQKSERSRQHIPLFRMLRQSVPGVRVSCKKRGSDVLLACLLHKTNAVSSSTYKGKSTFSQVHIQTNTQIWLAVNNAPPFLRAIGHTAHRSIQLIVTSKTTFSRSDGQNNHSPLPPTQDLAIPRTTTNTTDACAYSHTTHIFIRARTCFASLHVHASLYARSTHTHTHWRWLRIDGACAPSSYRARLGSSFFTHTHTERG